MILRFLYHKLLKRNYFIITSSVRVLPDFLIIGAKRCGTTSLFSHLPEHPSISKSHHDNMGFFNIWDFQYMGFLIHGPGRPVKLYFSVPVDLYTVFSDPKNPGQKPGQNSGQHFGQKSGHADHVLKT